MLLCRYNRSTNPSTAKSTEALYMDSIKKFRSPSSVFKNGKRNAALRSFSTKEEWIHSATHGSFAIFAIPAAVMLALRAAPLGAVHLTGAILFGLSLFILYSASALYHASCALSPNGKSRARKITQKLDHCSIFILIVGTYIPACFTSLEGPLGQTVFAAVGICCAVGFILNAISVERFQGVSLWIYIITGWTIALASAALYGAIGGGGFSLLLLGGIFYTAGVVFYCMQNLKYMHIIWHALVMLGSVSHYMMVYFYCY